MSLADLPIENLALIQEFFTANINYFDTRIVNLCRETREKMREHTWPTLYINELTARNMAVMTEYKFTNICTANADTHEVLTMLRPDLHVDAMYDDDGIYYGDANAYYDQTDYIINVSQPDKYIVTGRNIDVVSSCPYKLLIMSSSKTCDITLTGILPTVIELGGHRYYPYAHKCKSHTTRYRIYIANTDEYVYNGEVPDGYVSVTMEKLFEKQLVNGKLFNQVGAFASNIVHSAARELRMLPDQHINNFIDYIRGECDELYLPSMYDAERMLDLIKGELSNVF